MKPVMDPWPFWALLSAGFAALTALFATVGIADIGSDFATLIRTVVILLIVAGIVAWSGDWQSPAAVPGRTYLFLILSGLATGLSWLCYFRALKLGDASRVAPVDKLSVVIVAILGVLFLGESLTAGGWTGVALIAAGAIILATGV